MLKVSGEIWCGGATVTEDPYIPLALTWDVPAPSGVLYAFLEGGSGGYVELKFSRSNLALHELIVVDSPPEGQRGDPRADVPVHRDSVPCVHPSTWRWRETPDYREIEEESADEACEFLAVSRSPSHYTLRFSQDPPIKRLSSGAVAVGVSSEGAICDVSVNMEGKHW